MWFQILSGEYQRQIFKLILSALNTVHCLQQWRRTQNKCCGRLGNILSPVYLRKNDHCDICLTPCLLVDLKASTLWWSNLRAEISRCIVNWGTTVSRGTTWPSSPFFLSSANSMQACLSIVIIVNSSMCHEKKILWNILLSFQFLTWWAWITKFQDF